MTMALRARIERFLSPGLGCCYRCKRPWKHPASKRTGPRTWQQLDHDRFYGLIGVREHSTTYKGGGGCFPLCEGCWAQLTPEQRLPYYQQLVRNWIWQMPEDQELYEAKAKLIYEAVLDGG
jgi:hypothetical protein